MDSVRFGSGTLLRLADSLDAANDDLSTLLTKAEGHVSDIAARWQGTARDAFLDAMASWSEQMLNAIRVLSAFSQGLRMTQQAAITTDEERAEAFRRAVALLGGE